MSPRNPAGRPTASARVHTPRGGEDAAPVVVDAGTQSAWRHSTAVCDRAAVAPQAYTACIIRRAHACSPRPTTRRRRAAISGTLNESEAHLCDMERLSAPRDIESVVRAFGAILTQFAADDSDRYTRPTTVTTFPFKFFVSSRSKISRTLSMVWSR